MAREAYLSAFGPGGFRDPLTGQQLVRTKRPGFELVVSAHKSLSLLGVVGRADDMHGILDAETAGTWATWTRGRRPAVAAVAGPRRYPDLGAGVRDDPPRHLPGGRPACCTITC